MPEPAQLSADADALLALPIDETLTESKKLESWSYGEVFLRKAREAEADGNSKTASAWRLLGQLAQIRLMKSDAGEPFRPLLESTDGHPVRARPIKLNSG
jgi:hypothetical protein